MSKKTNAKKTKAKQAPKAPHNPRNAKLTPDPSRVPQPAMAPKREQPLGKRARIEAAARQGKLPEPPDFSAETHKRFRNKLASVVALAEAGDLDGLRAFEINPVSSSPKAIKRYRDLCVIALEVRKSPNATKLPIRSGAPVPSPKAPGWT